MGKPFKACGKIALGSLVAPTIAAACRCAVFLARRAAELTTPLSTHCAAALRVNLVYSSDSSFPSPSLDAVTRVTAACGRPNGVARNAVGISSFCLFCFTYHFLANPTFIVCSVARGAFCILCRSQKGFFRN